MSTESHSEQIARVRLMADENDTWDLSDNDIAALRTVLNERTEMLAALKHMVNTWEAYLTSPKGYPAYQKAVTIIAKAESA